MPYGQWPRPAAEKFIPAMIVKYGSATGWPALEEAAKYDFIDTGTSHCRVFREHGNTWKALKSVNPDMVLVAYKLGPGEYNTASWGQMGRGWDWLKENHGLAPADLPLRLAEEWERKNRWVAKGKKHGKILQGIPYPNERLMDPGRPGWQEYWYTTTYEDFWGGGRGNDCTGLDGIFSDNTGYEVIWKNRWHSVGKKEEKDHPDVYYENGQYMNSKWKEAMNVFLSRAVPWLRERGCILVLNFGYMPTDPEYWLELDGQPHPPYAAMEEGAFVHPWGSGPGLNFRSEQQWKNIVDTTLSLKNVRVIMTCLGRVQAKGGQKELMEGADKSGFRAWDAMWYSMASAKMCHDDTWTNLFLSFTVRGPAGGGFGSAFFLPDEWDPKYLHFGRAVGRYFRLSAKGSHIYTREFEDGWVAVNPTAKSALAVQIPGGAGRALDHDNFKKADELPYAATFDLPSHHGVFIVRPGREAGNKDNPIEIPPQFAAAPPPEHVGREGRAPGQRKRSRR